MAGRNWRVEELVYYFISFAGSALLLKWAIDKMDPNRSSLMAATQRQKQLEARLKRKIPLLQGLEANIASEVIDPEEIDVRLEDIGGLENIIKQLTNSIILPLQRPELFVAHLLHQPKGVLLHGPPGTGKTMLAKALARESGATFINIRASSIQSKWFGDTHKLVTAIFSLATKLQPAIIFIDEVDGLLGRRRDQDHEAITSLKTEFMQLWDGFLSERQSNILVLGATNRPKDLDDAVLRRFKLKFPVPLPDADQREKILKVTLKRHAEDSLVEPELLANEPSADGERLLQVLARQTPGFSGSDLYELCTQAAMVPVHEYIESETRVLGNGPSDPADAAVSPVTLHGPRPMAFRDLLQALETTKQSKEDVHQATDEETALPSQSALAKMLYFLLQAQQPTGNGDE